LVKKPRDSKIYKAVMQTIAGRAQGLTTKQVGELLGLTEETLYTYMKRAVRRGWINIGSFDSPEDRTEFILKDKTVRNLNEFLDARNDEVTVETAKGLGIFKQHQVVKGETNSMVGVALRVQVELPPSVQDSRIVVRPGTLGGTQALGIPIDADIAGDDPL
jgi:hypothetical protein